MKLTIFAGALLLAAFGLTPLAMGAPAAMPAPVPVKSAAMQKIENELARRLATPQAARAFMRYNAAHARKIQHNLADIYKSNDKFQADLKNDKHPLTDNVVGPVTLSWMRRFCLDFGIAASDPGFENDVVTSLEQIAAIARKYPDWLEILTSADFEAWINRQSTAERVTSLKIRRSGAAAQVNVLIAQYLKERKPSTQGKPLDPAGRSRLEETFGYDPKRPKVVKHPQDIANWLAPLQDALPMGLDDFKDAVQGRLAGYAVDDDTLGLIARYSEIDAYQLSADALVQLGNKGLPKTVISALEPMVDGEYGDVASFEEALHAHVTEPVDAAAMEPFQRQIAKASVIKRYRVPGTLAAVFASGSSLPEPVATVFAGMSTVDYPARGLLDSALAARVDKVLLMCRANWDDRQGELNAEQFDALAAVFPSQEKMFSRIRELRAHQGRCDAHTLLEADGLARQAYVLLSAQLEAKMLLKRFNMVAPVTPETRRKTGWAAPGCRCARSVSHDMVYALHPLWHASGERQLDFSRLSRIALYGVTVDGDGTWLLPGGMRWKDIPRDLIAAAHMHRTKIDWVIYKSDWVEWARRPEKDKKKALQELADKIVATLGTPLYDLDPHGTALASLGMDPGPSLGDGVTLDFQQFPPAESKILAEFITDLSVRLNAMKPARQLSIMVKHSDMTSTATANHFGYRNLIDLIKKASPISTDHLADIRVLVLLAEPTGEANKALRAGIEDELEANDGQRLLRDIVPVIAYDGASSEQLRDDMIYFLDNFGGIGFWTLPFVTPEDSIGTDARTTTGVNRLLGAYYQRPGDVFTQWENTMSRLCPSRWWLRWAFWLSLALAIGVGSYYFTCKGCNQRLDDNGFYLAGMVSLMALPFVVLLILVLSDPLFKSVAIAMLLLYAGGGVIATILIARYYFYKSKRKVP